MDTVDIIQIVGMCIGLLVGTGGVFALIKFLYAKKKDSNKYEVRCRLAAEFLKRDIVKMEPENAKQLFIDILEGKLEKPEKEKNKIANDIIKASKSKNKIFKGE